jgi:hypothetical protein
MTAQQALNEILPLLSLKQSIQYPALVKYLRANEDQIIADMSSMNSEKVMQASGKLMVVRETLNYFENQLEFIVAKLRQEINNQENSGGSDNG